MKLYVIMTNDFPTGVMDDGEKAKELVRVRNEADKVRAETQRQTRVYWNAYEFELNQVGK